MHFLFHLMSWLMCHVATLKAKIVNSSFQSPVPGLATFCVMFAGRKTHRVDLRERGWNTLKPICWTPLPSWPHCMCRNSQNSSAVMVLMLRVRLLLCPSLWTYSQGLCCSFCRPYSVLTLKVGLALPWHPRTGANMCQHGMFKAD